MSVLFPRPVDMIINSTNYGNIKKSLKCNYYSCISLQLHNYIKSPPLQVFMCSINLNKLQQREKDCFNMNQEQICNFSLCVETAAMQAGSFPPPPPGCLPQFLLLHEDGPASSCTCPLVRLIQSKECQLSKREGEVRGRQLILYCFLISMTKCRQKLDRNNLQGNSLFQLMVSELSVCGPWFS